VPDVVVLTGILMLLIGINGVYVGAEFALIAVRATRVARLATEGNRAAQVLQPILASPELQGRYLATTQLGITVASLGLGMYGEHAVASRFEPGLAFLGHWSPVGAHALAVALAVGSLTFLHVVLGEMVPKSVALRHPEPVALGLARVMALSQALFRPAVVIFTAVGRWTLRLLHVPAPSAHERILTPGELATIIGESAGGGLIPPREHQILLNILDFGAREAHQVMTPRTRIDAVPATIAPDDLASRLAQSRHTRFPVYDGDVDHIVGTLHLKDFIRWQLAADVPFDLRRLARPARMVPEHMSAQELMAIFRRERGHMAIVIDEYGGTAGLVTLEDVAEELVGELRDEFDVETPAVEILAPGRLQVHGDLLLADLAEYVRLPSDLPEVETVGGLLVTLLGRPAQVGDEVRIGALRLCAVAVNGLAVEIVQVVSSGEPSQ
jgi:CBS domain containing-hemolysin-like protein